MRGYDAIELLEFAKNNHFTDPNFAGTKITAPDSEEFMEAVASFRARELQPGYAPFCKHLFVENFTNARQGVLEITDENRHFLHSGYKARVDTELPVLDRWFEGIRAPHAPWLDIILYSKEQLWAEDIALRSDWGIVAVHANPEEKETPMSPITMMRNALGTPEGGSGVPLNREMYNESVAFWEKYARVM